MADVTFLRLPEYDHDFFVDDISTVDSFNLWAHHDRLSGPSFGFNLDDDDDLEFSVQIGVENGVVSGSDRKNQVNFVIDLFNQRVEESNLMGRDEIEENYDVGRSNLGVELGLGFVDQEIGDFDHNNSNHDDDDNDEDDFNFGGFVVSDCGDDFYIARRRENGNGSRNCDDGESRVNGLRSAWFDSGSGLESDGDVDEDGNVSRNCDGCESRVSGLRSVWVEPGSGSDGIENVRRRDNGNGGSRDCDDGEGRGSELRGVWFESGSDSDGGDDVDGIDNVLLGMHMHSDEDEDDDDFGVNFVVDIVNDDDNNNNDDLREHICWDSLHLEVEEEHGEANHDFEWEEVEDVAVDEREVLSFIADPEDEEGAISVLNLSGVEEDGERGRSISNLEWEVLLNIDNLDRNAEMENEGGHYFGDHDDFIYTAEYEMMFGQFADGESVPIGRPPASKAVTESLPSVVTTKEDVINEKSLCAVCKDHIEVGEEGKELPCSHRYHGDCIIPWLKIRNTCPVCRFELPTDDPDYEQRRARISSRVV